MSLTSLKELPLRVSKARLVPLLRDNKLAPPLRLRANRPVLLPLRALPLELRSNREESEMMGWATATFVARRSFRGLFLLC